MIPQDIINDVAAAIGKHPDQVRADIEEMIRKLMIPDKMALPSDHTTTSMPQSKP